MTSFIKQMDRNKNHWDCLPESIYDSKLRGAHQEYSTSSGFGPLILNMYNALRNKKEKALLVFWDADDRDPTVKIMIL